MHVPYISVNLLDKLAKKGDVIQSFILRTAPHFASQLVYHFALYINRFFHFSYAYGITILWKHV